MSAESDRTLYGVFPASDGKIESFAIDSEALYYRETDFEESYIKPWYLLGGFAISSDDPKFNTTPKYNGGAMHWWPPKGGEECNSSYYL